MSTDAAGADRAPSCPWCGIDMKVVSSLRNDGMQAMCPKCRARGPIVSILVPMTAQKALDAAANRPAARDEMLNYLEAVCRQRGIEMRAPDDYENYKLAMAASIARDDIAKRDALTAALAAARRRVVLPTPSLDDMGGVDEQIPFQRGFLAGVKWAQIALDKERDDGK